MGILIAPLYSITMLLVKIAIFLLYYRFFAIDRWTKIAIHIGMGITSCFYPAMLIVGLVLCTPKPKQSWTSMNYRERCSRDKALAEIFGAFSLVSDLYIFILPLPVLRRLNISSKKKIGVTATFLTGLM